MASWVLYAPSREQHQLFNGGEVSLVLARGTEWRVPTGLLSTFRRFGANQGYVSLLMTQPI